MKPGGLARVARTILLVLALVEVFWALMLAPTRSFRTVGVAALAIGLLFAAGAVACEVIARRAVHRSSA